MIARIIFKPPDNISGCIDTNVPGIDCARHIERREGAPAVQKPMCSPGIFKPSNNYSGWIDVERSGRGRAGSCRGRG